MMGGTARYRLGRLFPGVEPLGVHVGLMVKKQKGLMAEVQMWKKEACIMYSSRQDCSLVTVN